MLRFKIKEMLLSMDKRTPHAWLMKHCGFRNSKAHNLLNNKQKAISISDLATLCVLLNCTPNDLFWWENKARTNLPPDHPLMTKLEPPDKKPLWTEKIQNLTADQMRLVRDFLDSVSNPNPPPSEPTNPEPDQDPLSPV